MKQFRAVTTYAAAALLVASSAVASTSAQSRAPRAAVSVSRTTSTSRTHGPAASASRWLRRGAVVLRRAGVLPGGRAALGRRLAVQTAPREAAAHEATAASESSAAAPAAAALSGTADASDASPAAVSVAHAEHTATEARAHVAVALPSPALPRLRALTRGIVVDGPRHTIAAIRERPLQFSLMVAGVGLVGGASYALGVDPEHFMLTASLSALGLQLRQATRAVRQSFGTERWRLVGSEMLWPAAFAAGTTLLGFAVGPEHGAAASAGATPSVSVGGTVQAAGQSVLIGGDAPGVAITALSPVGTATQSHGAPHGTATTTPPGATPPAATAPGTPRAPSQLH